MSVLLFAFGSIAAIWNCVLVFSPMLGSDHCCASRGWRQASWALRPGAEHRAGGYMNWSNVRPSCQGPACRQTPKSP